jgi:hypothetical protein
MWDPDGANHSRGENLQRLVREVRQEFFARDARESGRGYQQINSTRVVTIEVYDRLSVDAQIAVAEDLMRASDEVLLHRSAEEVFSRSDTPQACIADLICELVYQELMDDPLVIMENEARESLQ